MKKEVAKKVLTRVKKATPSKKEDMIENAQNQSHSKRGLWLVLFFLVAALGILWIGLSTVNQKPIEAFLPTEETLGFLEMKEARIPHRLQTGKEDKAVLGGLQQLTKLPLDKLPASWWNHPFGLILLEGDEGKNEWVLFAQGQSRRQMATDLKSLGMEGEGVQNKGEWFAYAQGLNFSFRFPNHYVFLSQSEQAINIIEQVSSDKQKILMNQADFQKIQNHSKGRSWIKAYVRTEKFNLPDLPALNYALNSLSSSAPFISFNIQSVSEGLRIKTFLGLNPSEVETLEIKTKGQAQDLLTYVPSQTTAFYMGGASLTGQWQKTLADLSVLNPAYGVVLEGLARAQVEELFGGNVNLRNDLYPLFEGAYAAFLSQGENGYSLGVAMGHDDKGFVDVKLEKLLNGFYALVGQLSPQVKVVTLPDGTESKELVSNTQNGEKETEDYAGLTLNCLSAELSDVSTVKGELLRSFCYTSTPEILLMATNKDLLKQMIDAGEGDVLALNNGLNFKQGLSELNGVGEDLGYLNLTQLAPLLAKNKTYEPVVKGLMDLFEGGTWVKNESKDGVSFEGFVGLK